MVRNLVYSGATVVLAENDPVIESSDFLGTLLVERDDWHATLAYGQRAQQAGLHAMTMPTVNPAEVLTGLGGSGAFVMVVHTDGVPLQPHPMVPVMQISTASRSEKFRSDLDLLIEKASLLADPNHYSQVVQSKIADVVNGRYEPKMQSRGFTEFQLTRGRFGVSL
jgi:altronate dehydratase